MTRSRAGRETVVGGARETVEVAGSTESGRLAGHQLARVKNQRGAVRRRDAFAPTDRTGNDAYGLRARSPTKV